MPPLADLSEMLAMTDALDSYNKTRLISAILKKMGAQEFSFSTQQDAPGYKAVLCAGETRTTDGLLRAGEW